MTHNVQVLFTKTYGLEQVAQPVESQTKQFYEHVLQVVLLER